MHQSSKRALDNSRDVYLGLINVPYAYCTCCSTLCITGGYRMVYIRDSILYIATRSLYRISGVYYAFIFLLAKMPPDLRLPDGRLAEQCL